MEEASAPGLLVWADNLYVWADDWTNLQRRVQGLDRQLRKCGFCSGEDSLVVMRNVFVPVGTCELQNGFVFKEVGNIISLGVCLDKQGHSLISALHRRACALAVLRRHAGIPWSALLASASSTTSFGAANDAGLLPSRRWRLGAFRRPGRLLRHA